ncbi:MAG: hypothetical protein IPL35_07515 [Sphingobacteriales bacterium]|nr:hypothetical protein [Sphingobacteriales bacterium]
MGRIFLLPTTLTKFKRSKLTEFRSKLTEFRSNTIYKTDIVQYLRNGFFINFEL